MGEIGTPSLWTFWKKSCRYRNHWPGGEAPGFFVMKKTAQKHGYKSVPDSIAGLSESGGSAKP